MARHEILGGLVQVYKRGGRYWNCSASIDGHQHRATTKKDDLSLAEEFAEDWYLGLRGKARAGLLKTEKTFSQAADRFEKEYVVITEGQRSQRWTEGHKIRIRLPSLDENSMAHDWHMESYRPLHSHMPAYSVSLR